MSSEAHGCDHVSLRWAFFFLLLGFAACLLLLPRSTASAVETAKTKVTGIETVLDYLEQRARAAS